MSREDQVADKITATYDKIDVKVEDIAQEHPEYFVYPFMMKKGRVKKVKSGLGVGQMLMVDYGGESNFITDMTEDNVQVRDHLEKIRVDFCLQNDSCTYFKSELQDNAGPELIANIIEPRKRAMMMRMITTMESKFFDDPESGNNLVPWGLKYWIVKNATTGFNGGIPAGFSDIAGITMAQAPAFKNYTGSYAALTEDDMTLLIKKCIRRTNFRSPISNKNISGDTYMGNKNIITNETVCEAAEKLATYQNQNIGNDIAAKTAGGGAFKYDANGEVVVKRLPIINAWELDSDTSNPIYGLDLSQFYCLVKSGDDWARTPFTKAPKQHRAYVSHTDHRYQWFCKNRKALWVIYQS